MNNLTGTMIEMNVHMVSREYADALILIGVCLIIGTAVFFLFDLKQSKRFRISMLGYLASLVIGLGLWLYGARIPKDKIISYCANGPVSIEQISVNYDIVEIDGKLIKLKERR